MCLVLTRLTQALCKFNIRELSILEKKDSKDKHQNKYTNPRTTIRPLPCFLVTFLRSLASSQLSSP